MSYRNMLFALVVAAAVTGATACGASSTPHPIASNAASPATTLAARSQAACADLGGSVDAEQICHVHTVGRGYEVTFTFPVDYPDQQTLTTYLTQRREDFRGYASDWSPQDRPYELDARAIAYHSGTPTSGTMSLVFEEYSDSGGAHPSTGFQSFTYDRGKGAPITLDTLFTPGTQPVKVLDPIVRRELLKRWGDTDAPMPDNMLGAKVYQHFALTDEAVIFFIGQGQWLSQVDGPQEVSVPRTELSSVLT
jgi:hypothetical protein